ncbi:hypothetical protein SEUCBS140593_002217 [Sporothrix eucalyptigena]|uniref:Arrestin-like N-terminal domain-containing protein n=1 Tax=Sporothrix eucalyptigena TaxID=1812306 RepID=A0ABP0B4P4_9PEZI
MAEINKLSSTLASPRPTVKIRIVLAGDAVHGPGHVPVKQGGQEIAGFVEVVIRPEMDIDVDLAFEGCVRTWMRAPSNTPDQKQLPHSVAESKFLEQVQTLQTATDAARGQDDLRTVHLPFHFVVPRRLIAAHDNLPGAFLGLSPTACLGPTYTCPYTGKLYAQPSITYSVRVRQLRGHEACFMDASSCLAREVKMIPANDPLPPPTGRACTLGHRVQHSLLDDRPS